MESEFEHFRRTGVVARLVQPVRRLTSHRSQAT